MKNSKPRKHIKRKIFKRESYNAQIPSNSKFGLKPKQCPDAPRKKSSEEKEAMEGRRAALDNAADANLLAMMDNIGNFFNSKETQPAPSTVIRKLQFSAPVRESVITQTAQKDSPDRSHSSDSSRKKAITTTYLTVYSLFLNN